MDFHFVRRSLDHVSRTAEQSVLRDPRHRLLTLALAQARRDVGDEAAAAALRMEIRDIPAEEVNHNLSEWSRRRQDYLADRAYRLLGAARSGGPLAAINPDDRVRIEQEARLGRLPLRDAFEILAEAEPELRRMERGCRHGQEGASG